MSGSRAIAWLVAVLCQCAVFSWSPLLLSCEPSVCCLAVPVVLRPQFVGPRISWFSCLSLAIQLALVLQVPVGSLLPYGSPPSRWGHPSGVEASFSSIGTKVECVLFPFWAVSSCCLGPSGYSHQLGQVCWSVPASARPTVVVGASHFLLLDGLRPSV